MSIFYKFKSQKEYKKFVIDSSGISVRALKNEIEQELKLENIAILHENLELKDDFVVQKNQFLILKRIPVSDVKKFKGGGGHSHPQQQVQVQPAVNPARLSGQMDQMFKQQNMHWQSTLDKMSQSKQIPQKFVDTRPPPPGYICYRCGKQGHHIHSCPTIGDPLYDNRPKLKKTTGIPKMFLKAVEEAPGCMVTQDGDFVVAQPNDQSWAKISNKKKAFRSVNVNEYPPDLGCLICQRLLKDAMTTPCCRTDYCDEYVEPRFTCPKCYKNLVPDQLLVSGKRDGVELFLRGGVDEEPEQAPTEPSGVKPEFKCTRL